MRKFIMFALALSFLFLAACGDDANEEEAAPEEAAEPEAEESVDISDEEKVDEDEVVADINGTEVVGDSYNLVYVQIKMDQQQFGEEVDDADFLKDAAVDTLIGQELVIQDAKDMGIEVGDDEVDSQFETFKEENGDQFTALLDEYQLSEDAFKEQLAFSLVHEQYLDADVPEIEVTDEEIEENYEQLKEENEEIPELEDVKEQLELGLKQEKLQDKIEQLKEKADIETMI